MVLDAGAKMDRPPSVTGAAALVPHVAGNSRVALEDIFRGDRQRLFRIAFHVLRDAGDSEDVIQDSYVRARLGLPSFAGRSGLYGWVARIVRNQAIDALRSRRARFAAVMLESELPNGVDDTRRTLDRAASVVSHDDPAIECQRDDTRAQLRRAIALLPAPFRSVFVLRDVEELDVGETALCLHIPIATVKSRERRARLRLREELRSGL